MNLVFIIPSKGRATLANTLLSIYEQECPYIPWNAIVAFDAVEPTIDSYFKVEAFQTSKKLGEAVNSAGNVRNFAVEHLGSLDHGFTWLGFVDDDDTLDKSYLTYLHKSIMYKGADEPDLVIFRMKYQDGTILPPPEFKYPENCNAAKLENKVGISFACTLDLFKKLGGFVPSGGEDADFIKRAEAAGARIHLSNEVAYYVCPLGVPPDRRK